MKIKKGDIVLISNGKDKGRTGKVLRAVPTSKNILIEGINLKSKSVRPKKSGEKGQVIKKPGPVDVSNVKLICPKCKKATKLEQKKEKDKKYRICKKCKSEV